MRKLLYILLVGIFIYSCTSEPDVRTYTTRIRNSSNSILNIKGHDTQDNLVYNELVGLGGSSTNCVTSSESFLGLSCSIDSLIVKFDNNRGYICAVRITNNQPELCFSNKTPFGNDPSFLDLGNNTYEFVITQEDFENAYDLPK